MKSAPVIDFGFVEIVKEEIVDQFDLCNSFNETTPHIELANEFKNRWSSRNFS